MSEDKELDGRSPADAGSGQRPFGVEPASAVSSIAATPNAGEYVRSLPWRPMGDFPKTGEIVAVMFYAWGVKTNDPQIQFAQWLDIYGSGGEICSPWNPDDHPYAEGWLHLNELQPASATGARSDETPEVGDAR